MIGLFLLASLRTTIINSLIDEKKKVLRVALRPEDLLQEGRSRIFEDFVSKLFCHTNDATPVFKYKLVQKHQTEAFPHHNFPPPTEHRLPRNFN
jgi:hypothetical protein